MDIAQLGISVDSRQVKTATGDLDRLAGASGKAEKATGGVTSATQAFGSALASLGIAAATSQLVKMADTYGLLQSKIGLATGEITKAAEATDMVFAAAQRARVGLDELGSMVARLAPSIRDMGGTTQDAVAASELFAKTLKISGATAEESASAILQFGQALGTGRLGGEEFNAVNESSGRYMQLLAKELGVTRGELKKMAEDGKLTGDVLINALANNATVLEGEFQQLRVTGAETFEQLSNSTMQAAFELDKASGVSQTFNGVMNAGRGVIDAVTLALRGTNDEANNSGVIIPAATKVFQTLGIVAAETVYVFKETGRTLGALAAQAAALAQGDLDLYKRIGEERDRDSAAARAAVDKLTASIANSETATAKLATTAPKLSTGLKAVKTSADDNSKALKAAQRIAEQAADAYGDLERSLRKQLLTEDDLTTAQKVSMDLTDKRYKHLSEKQKANLIALAKEVDAFKAQEKLFKDMAASAQELADADTKRQQAAVDAAYQSRKAVEDQLAKLQEEADTYGMTESEIQRYLLAKAEEKLALEKGGEARQGVIDQLEKEIEARKQLTTATGAAETRKATEALGGAVQGTIADAIKAGLNADNPIKGFAQSLGNSVKNALYDAVAKGLAARITGAFSFGAASGAASAAGGGADAGSLLGLLGAATGGNSIGAGLAGGALGGEFGIFANAGNVSNLALAGYGLAGGLFGNLIGAGKTGSSLGGLGAAGGALIGGPLGAAVGGLAGSVLGGVLGGAWKGGGGQKFGGEGAIGRANAGLFPEGQTDAQVQAALQTFSTGLTDVAKKFGGTLNNLGFAYGYETDPKGTAGNFFSSVLEVNGQILRNVQVQKFSGEVSDQMASEFKTATVLALKAANLSADLQTAFDGFDPAIEGAADKVMARLEEIKAVADAFESLGKAMPQLSGLSLQARESLIQLAGGAEALASGVSTYYDAFYSEAEKTTRATEQLSAQMSALGLAMPETKEGFRALVEAQDLTTESGRKTYASLIGMSGAFASVAETAEKAGTASSNAAEAAQKAADVAQERASLELRLLEEQGNAAEVLTRNRQAELAAVDATNRALLQSIYAEQDRKAAIQAADSAAQASLQALRTAVDAEKNSIGTSLQNTINGLESRAKAEKIAADAIYKAQTAAIKTARDAQKAVFDAAKEAAQKSISALNSVFSLVSGKQVDTADSVAASLSGRQSALASLSSIGSGIRGGADASQFQDQLASAMGVIAQPSEQLYSSFTDYQFDQRRANAEISSIAKGTKSQIDLAELTLQTMIEADKRAEALADEQIKQLAQSYDFQVSALDAQLENAKLLATQQAERDMAALDKQVADAERQYNALVGIDNGVRSVAIATNGVAASLSQLSSSINASLAAAKAASKGNTATSTVSIPAAPAGTGAAPSGTLTADDIAREAAITQLYNSVLGRAPDTQGLTWYLSSGKSIDEIAADLSYAKLNGSHRNGLAEVPFDGYRAELHAGERVLTAQQADSSDKMAVDIAEMRREMASAMLAIADNTRRTARLQERWDGDGLPDARGY